MSYKKKPVSELGNSVVGRIEYGPRGLVGDHPLLIDSLQFFKDKGKAILFASIGDAMHIFQKNDLW
jgi:hypothetical protein